MITITGKDYFKRNFSAEVVENQLTAQLLKGGTLQNTKKNFTYEDELPVGFQFGKEIEMNGWQVDRRQANINEINRELRRVVVRCAIYKEAGQGRVPCLDCTDTPYYVEFQE